MTHSLASSFFFSSLEQTVQRAIEEDVGSGDITAELVPANAIAQASVLCREHAVICGRPWVDEVFRQIDPAVELHWHHEDGSSISPEELVFSAHGPARALLTAERTALNFLQTL